MREIKSPNSRPGTWLYLIVRIFRLLESFWDVSLSNMSRCVLDLMYCSCHSFISVSSRFPTLFHLFSFSLFYFFPWYVETRGWFLEKSWSILFFSSVLCVFSVDVLKTRGDCSEIFKLLVQIPMPLALWQHTICVQWVGSQAPQEITVIL